jgi:hypothetical protein
LKDKYRAKYAAKYSAKQQPPEQPPQQPVKPTYADFRVANTALARQTIAKALNEEIVRNTMRSMFRSNANF